MKTYFKLNDYQTIVDKNPIIKNASSGIDWTKVPKGTALISKNKDVKNILVFLAYHQPNHLLYCINSDSESCIFVESEHYKPMVFNDSYYSYKNSTVQELLGWCLYKLWNWYSEDDFKFLTQNKVQEKSEIPLNFDSFIKSIYVKEIKYEFEDGDPVMVSFNSIIWFYRIFKRMEEDWFLTYFETNLNLNLNLNLNIQTYERFKYCKPFKLESENNGK